MAIDVALMAAVAMLAESQGAEAAAKRCDLPAFQAAVEQIEDQAFASLKAANEAVAVAARGGSVGDAGDADWARYKSLRAEAERLRYGQASRFSACLQTAQTPGQQVATATAPEAAPAAAPLSTGWSLTYNVAGGDISGDGRDRVARVDPFLPNGYTNVPSAIALKGDRLEAALGVSRSVAGPAETGWLLSATAVYSLTEGRGRMPEIPVAPPSSYPIADTYYQLPPTARMAQIYPESRLEQTSESYGVMLEASHRFGRRTSAGSFYIQPGIAGGLAYSLFEEDEYLEMRPQGSVDSFSFGYTRELSGPRADLAVKLELGGGIDVGPWEDRAFWSLGGTYGMAAIDLSGIEKQLQDLQTGYLPAEAPMDILDRFETWSVGIRLGYELVPGLQVAFTATRKRDAYLSTILSGAPAAKPPSQRISTMPLDIDTYGLALNYRF